MALKPQGKNTCDFLPSCSISGSTKDGAMTPITLKLTPLKVTFLFMISLSDENSFCQVSKLSTATGLLVFIASDC